MNKRYAQGAGMAALLAAGVAFAELPEDYKYVEPPSDDHPLGEIISGIEFRTPDVREMQEDDFANPAYELLEYGAELWDTVDGSEGKSCASCHEDAEVAMAGVGSTYPKVTGEGEHRTLRNIENQINFCRTENMGAEAWKYDKPELLGMTVFVRNVDHGEPVEVTIDGEAADWFERGKDLYYTRVGQLDMACANCHEDNYGRYIRADHLSQGQTNGFPLFRLKWQGVGSLHRRFKGCMDNIRAIPYDRGGDEFLALELYTAWRGQGLEVETPAVRN